MLKHIKHFLLYPTKRDKTILSIMATPMYYLVLIIVIIIILWIELFKIKFYPMFWEENANTATD